MPGVLALRFSVFKTNLPLLVSRTTRVCVDGFPRSGNTFAVLVVRDHLSLSLREMAHHTHSVVNLDRAVARGIPAFMPVREPVACCLSLAAVGDAIDVDDALRAYLDFHQACLSRLPRISLVRFEEMIVHPRPLVERAALALGVPSPSADVDVKAVLTRRAVAARTNSVVDPDQEYPSLPDPGRSRRMAELWERSQSARTTRLVEQCRALYERVIASAPNVVGTAVTAARP